MPVERQREYETIYIVRPDASDEDFSTIGDRVEKIIDDEGGHLLRNDDWGRRKLAYEIKDKTEGRMFEQGIYHYYRYMVPPGTVSEVERHLRLLDPVLKFLTVKLNDDLIPDERLARSEEEDVVVPE